MVHLVFHLKLVLLRFSCQVEMFFKDSGVLVSSPRHMTRSSTHPTVGARMLPPKLYLVVFLSREPVESDKDNLFELQKTFSLAFGKLCCTISHVHTPLGEL